MDTEIKRSRLLVLSTEKRNEEVKLSSDVHNRPPILSQMYTTDLPSYLRCTQPTSHLISDVHNRPPILSQMYTTDLPSYLRCTQPTSLLITICVYISNTVNLYIKWSYFLGVLNEYHWKLSNICSQHPRILLIKRKKI